MCKQRYNVRSNPGQVALPAVRAGDGDAAALARHARREPAAAQRDRARGTGQRAPLLC